MTPAVRKRAVKKTPKVLAHKSAYIDPLDADSTVSYKVVQGTKRIWGSVQLADCNRKIEWSFGVYGNSKPLEKIDAAIELLNEFRDKFAEAIAKPRRSKKEKTCTTQ